MLAIILFKSKYVSYFIFLNQQHIFIHLKLSSKQPKIFMDYELLYFFKLLLFFFNQTFSFVKIFKKCLYFIFWTFKLFYNQAHHKSISFSVDNFWFSLIHFNPSLPHIRVLFHKIFVSMLLFFRDLKLCLSQRYILKSFPFFYDDDDDNYDDYQLKTRLITKILSLLLSSWPSSSSLSSNLNMFTSLFVYCIYYNLYEFKTIYICHYLCLFHWFIICMNKQSGLSEIKKKKSNVCYILQLSL